MYAQMIREAVATIEFAEPVMQGVLSILPLKTQVQVVPQYILLGQALERGIITIAEVGEAGSVPVPQATNEGPWPVLILDGEELVGAKHDRIANVTILVGVGKSVLPVSCVEQRVREAMAVDTAMREMRSCLGPDSRQPGDLHDQRDGAMRSPTMAMADIYDSGQDDPDEMVQGLAFDHFGAVDQMVGVIVFVGGRFVCLDLLYPAECFRALYPKLLRGYTREARLRKDQESLEVDPEAAALRLFAALLKADVKNDLGADLGIDLRIDGDDLQGAALVWDDQLVQLSLYPKTVA